MAGFYSQRRSRRVPTHPVPTMRLHRIAHHGYAAGLTGLGVLSLLSGDFALNWQPVPPNLPLRTLLAYASGAILLGGGGAMLVRRTANLGVHILTAFVLSWLILLQLPRVASSPTDVGTWLGFGENTVLVTGGWVLCILARTNGLSPMAGGVLGRPGWRAARILFALALPVIGLSHFKYIDATASMVPAWLPDRRAFAYLTGAGHVAAGIALLIGVVPRLAATMEAAMITAFVVLLHLPGVAAEPGSRLQWTMLCVATALASAAWAVAASCFAPPVGSSSPPATKGDTPSTAAEPNLDRA